MSPFMHDPKCSIPGVKAERLVPKRLLVAARKRLPSHVWGELDLQNTGTEEF
jgi:hypothetical protein